MSALATAGGAPLVPHSPTPLTPSGLNGIGRDGFAENHRRHVAGAHDRIVHECAGFDLPVVAVEHLLAQGFAETLGDAAVNLSLDDHRVDDHAAVVDHDEFFQVKLAGVALDADQRDMGAEAPGFALGIEEAVSCRPISMPLRHSAAVGGRRDLAPGDFFVGHAFDGETAVGLDDVFRRRFDQVRGDAFAFVITRSAAVASAPPPTTALRLPKVPVPCWLTWVSPCRTVT